MATIILITPTEEIKVGTLKSLCEALQCAALLQAITVSNTYTYWVEHRYKGTLRRTQPNNLRVTVGNLKSLYDHLRPLYISTPTIE